MAQEMIRDRGSTDLVPFPMDDDSEHDTQQLDYSSSSEEEVEYHPSGYVPTLEEIAETNEEHRRKEQRDRQKQDLTRKRQRDSVARERRELAEDADFIADEDDDEEVAETSLIRKISRKKNSKISDEQNEEIDFLKEFIDIGFTEPIYPCEESMKYLGIKDDVELLLRHYGIDKFVTKVHSAYPAAAAEFLATVAVTEFRNNPALMSKYGGGLITFNYKGKQESLDFNEINEIFGFSPGEPRQLAVDKEDINLAWRLLTKQKVMPPKVKATVFIHPSISYARRVVAKTFFCRSDIGAVISSDMQFLTIAFAKEYKFEEPYTMQGDRAGAGLAYVLCKNLEGIRGKVSTCIKRKVKFDRLLCGGIITALLEKAGITLDGEQYFPKYMNIEYLRLHGVITGPRIPYKYHYKFIRNGGQVGIVELPNKELVSLVDIKDVRFHVPDNLLLDQAAINSIKAPPPAKRPEPYRQPPKRKPEAGPCMCTTDGFRDKLVAELTKKIRAEVQQEIKDGIEKGLADLSKTFVKKPVRQTETTPRKDSARDDQRADDTPAPTRRTEGPRHHSLHDVTEVQPRQKLTVRYNSNKPPPPRRT